MGKKNGERKNQKERKNLTKRKKERKNIKSTLTRVAISRLTQQSNSSATLYKWPSSAHANSLTVRERRRASDNQTAMEASLFRVNSVPNHRSILSGTSVFSRSRIAAGVPLRRRRGDGGGSSSRGSDDAIARRSAPGGSRSRHAAAGGCARSSEIGDHYRQMLASSPDCSLLLRNYAEYLHKVNAERRTAKT